MSSRTSIELETRRDSSAVVYEPTAPQSARVTESRSATVSRAPSTISHATVSELLDPPRSNETSLPPTDRGRAAYTFLACCCLFEIVTLGYLYSFSIFQEFLPARFPGASNVAISAVGTIALAFPYFLPLFSQGLYRRYPEYVRPTCWISLLAGGLAMLGSSWATSIGQLIILQGVLYGASIAITYLPVVLYMYQWFSEKRGIAWGVICAGGALGGFACPLILGAMLEKIGYSNTLRAYATFFLIFGGLALTGIKPREPLPPRTAPRAPYLPQDIKWIKSPLFWLTLSVVAVQSLGYFTVTVYITPFTDSLGYKPFYGQLALALFNAAGAAGQIGAGFASDRRDYALSMMTTSAVCAIAAWTALGFASSLAVVFVFVILFGAAAGGFGSAWPAAANDIALSGQSQYVFACLAAVKGLAGVLGPSLAGALRQTTTHRSTFGGVGFENIVILVGCSMLVACGGSLGIRLMHRRRKDGTWK